MEKIEKPASPEQIVKQERWDQISADIEKITDTLGMPIDSDIKETVIALKAAEINPIQSCEGHLDRGIAAPWVDIADPEAIAMSRKINWLEKPVDYSAKTERKKVRDAIEKKNLDFCRKALVQLEAFYATRDSSFDQRLILQQSAQGTARIESQVTMFQKIADEKTKEIKLAAYREEMDAFAAFLKEEFFKTKN